MLIEREPWVQSGKGVDNRLAWNHLSRQICRAADELDPKHQSFEIGEDHASAWVAEDHPVQKAALSKLDNSM